MPGNGYAPNSTVQLSQEPVAIIAVDTGTRMAQGLTRVRVVVNIDCTYPLGGVYVLPAVGDQWYIERLNDRHWKLVTRIPFNDDNTLIEAVPGQMVIGGTGPVVLNGSSLDVRGDTHIDGSLSVGGDPATTYGEVPATATSPGRVGEIACDGSRLYICIATNTWRRVTVSSW